MEEAGESPMIKSSILDERFFKQLGRVQGDHGKMLQFERQLLKTKEEIEQELLDINLFYLVQPEQNFTSEPAKEI